MMSCGDVTFSLPLQKTSERKLRLTYPVAREIAKTTTYVLWASMLCIYNKYDDWPKSDSEGFLIGIYLYAITGAWVLIICMHTSPTHPLLAVIMT